MKYSSNQLQLLSLLNIEPLALHSVFKHPTDTKDSELPLYPDVTHPLAQDIDLLLQSFTAINEWQLDTAAMQSRLDNSVLYTPELNMLQQPELKKQLWQLLQQQDAE